MKRRGRKADDSTMVQLATTVAFFVYNRFPEPIIWLSQPTSKCEKLCHREASTLRNISQFGIQ